MQVGYTHSQGPMLARMEAGISLAAHLKNNGAAAVFGPGTFIPDAVRELLAQLNKRMEA